MIGTHPPLSEPPDAAAALGAGALVDIMMSLSIAVIVGFASASSSFSRKQHEWAHVCCGGVGGMGSASCVSGGAGHMLAGEGGGGRVDEDERPLIRRPPGS